MTTVERHFPRLIVATLAFAGFSAVAQTQDAPPAEPDPSAELQPAPAQPVERVGQASGPFSEIGNGVRQGVREAGQAVKQVGTGIGHAARDSARAVGSGVSDAAKGVGSATRSAVDEVKQGPAPATTPAREPAPVPPAPNPSPSQP